MSEERQYVSNFTFPNGETFYVKDTEAREDIEELKEHGGEGSGDINVQSDWDQIDSTADDYIKNKPDIYTKNEINQKLVGAMIYKGTKAAVSELPNSGNQQGDVWHITADGSEWAWNGSTWEELGSAPVQSVNGRTGAVTVNEVPDATSATVGQVLAKTQYGPRWANNIPGIGASLRLLYDSAFDESDPDLMLQANLADLETGAAICGAIVSGIIGSAVLVDVSSSNDVKAYDLYAYDYVNGIVVFAHTEGTLIRTATLSGSTKTAPVFGTIPLAGGSANAVLYTPQSLTAAQKVQARENIGAYSKPSGGIPKTDLATDVQTSLGKADTALQTAPVTSVNNKTGAVTLTASDVGAYVKPSGGIPKTDLAQAVQDALDATSSGLTEEVKQALLDCFEHVAWIDADGQDYYDALYDALYPPVDVLSISAVFTQGDAVIYDTDSLDDLKQYLVVTATMDDSTTRTLEDTDYTLSGTLTVGTSTITVSYGGKTTTFNVVVTQEELMLNDILTLDGIRNTRNGHDSSATTWEDLSGNDNDFAKLGTNAPVWNADNAQFDATDRTLGITKNLFGTDTSVSVEIVLEISGNGSGVDGSTNIGGVFTNREYSTDNNGIDLYSYNYSGMSAYWKSNSLGYTGSLANTIAYICYVFTGGNCLRYVNGVLASTNAAATFFDGTARRDKFRIGGTKKDAATWFCNAKIYRIGIDSTAFTAETVAERFAYFADRFGIATES